VRSEPARTAGAGLTGRVESGRAAPTVRVLALSGSLRARSYSAALLRACGMLAPAGTEVLTFTGLGALPLFNPDIEAHPGEPVRHFWRAVAQADALLIASPEYAHGVTGTMKNALDWLVGLTAFVGMPVAVLNPSSQSTHADAALRETLRTMSADLIEAACLRIPVNGSRLDDAQIRDDPRFAGPIGQMHRAIRAHCAARMR
jgi:chromate reductase, NAD(P)H dehydrogenase (quinone)